MFFLASDLNVTPPGSNPLENEPRDLFSLEDTGASVSFPVKLTVVK